MQFGKKTPKKNEPKEIKLEKFIYEGKNKDGNPVKGEIASPNVILAKAELRRIGIIPIKMKKLAAPKGRKNKVGPAEIAFFSRQMATMMSAGVPLIQSFDIVAAGTDNVGLANLVSAIRSDIEAGRSFSEAIAKHPKMFDDLYVSLITAGEASGALETMLDRIAIYKEKSESLKRKIKKALTYPTAVMVIAIIVTGILLIFVVPQFENLFKGFGADLPAFTQLVINLSRFMQAYWYLMAGILIGGVIFLKKLKDTSKPFNDALDRAILKAPIIGNIMNKAAVARYTRTLATTFAAGVPLVEALDSVAGACGNVVYYNAVKQIKEDITTGTQMQVAMKATGVFPSMVIQMVGIGEEAGALDKMLSKVADIYEEEVDLLVDSLSTLIEPMIMAILGVLVGGLVVAMYLPIFKMGSAI